MAKQSKKWSLIRRDRPMGCRNLFCKFLWAIHALGRDGDAVQMRLLHPVTWLFLPIVVLVSVVGLILSSVPEFIHDLKSAVCLWYGESERSNEK